MFYVPCSIKDSPLSFLVDTGSAISVVPRQYAKHINPTTQLLKAANGTNIKTFGTATLEISIRKLRRTFHWTCFIAEVTSPLLGADFLRHFDLLVDMKRQKLIDNLTKCKVDCKSCPDSKILQLYPIQAIDTRIPPPIYKILDKFKSLTQDFTGNDPPKHTTTHQIITNAPPVHSRVRPLYGEKLMAVREEFQKLQELGIVKESHSPWASPIHLVPKGTGWRICGDYRRLNAVTKRDSYPMPNVNALYTLLHGSQIFTTLDLVRGYNQIPMAQDSIEKTAVITPVGLYEYLRMPFGLCNAAQSFQRFMHSLIGHLPYTFVYIDDVLIFSRNKEEHLKHVEEVLRILHTANLRIGLEKCHFMTNVINFLGFSITANGITPNKKKCEAIADFPVPQTFHELHRFLGSIGFYRKHIHHFAHKAYLLNELLRKAPSKNAPLDLNDQEMLTFEALKLELLDLTEHSFIDPSSQEFTITTDASKTAIGGVLHQIINSESHIIQFYSRKLNDCESRYSTFDRELLAAHDAVQFFLPFAEGQHITLFTDHKPLTFAIHKKSDCKSDRQARHLSFLSEHVSQLLYIKGKENVVADCLSRTSSVSSINIDVFDLDTIAEKQSNDVQLQSLTESEGNNISKYKFKEKDIWCEMSEQYPRPFIPEELRYSAFSHLHQLGHPGKTASTRITKQRYYWPKMVQDIREWCKQCEICQQQKVIRHTHPKVKEFPDPIGRFTTVHMDIVGPLPTVNDHSGAQSPYRYIVTFIDRFTRWIEACPITGITTEEVASALISTWISRFGVPLELVTDRGKQFESELFHHLARTMGFMRLRTTAYNPKSNGLIERQHRTLKNILRSHKTDWLSALPIALFAMRITPSQSTQQSPFVLVTGNTAHIPSTALEKRETNLPSFVEKLAQRMDLLKFSPTQWNNINIKEYIPPLLKDCTKVWVRIDRIRKPLEAPYAGPYEVVDKNDKYFTIKYPSGRMDTIALHRLKPYHTATRLSHTTQQNTVVKSNTNSKEISDTPYHTDDALTELDNHKLDSLLTNIPSDDESDSTESAITEETLPNHAKFAKRIPFKTRSGRTVQFTNNDVLHTYIRPDYEFEEST